MGSTTICHLSLIGFAGIVYDLSVLTPQLFLSLSPTFWIIHGTFHHHVPMLAVSVGLLRSSHSCCSHTDGYVILNSTDGSKFSACPLLPKFLVSIFIHLSVRLYFAGAFSSRISFIIIPLSSGCVTPGIFVRYSLFLLCADTSAESISIGYTHISSLILSLCSFFIFTFSSRKYFG